MDIDETLRRAARRVSASLAEAPVPDAPRRPRRGWLVLALGAFVTIGVVGGLALLTRDGRVPPVGIGPASSTGSPPSTATTMPGRQVESAPLEPLTEVTNSIVLLTTDTHLTVIDVDAAAVTVSEVPELEGDPLFVRRGDRLAFDGRTVTGGPAVFALDPQRPTSPVLVDRAWFFIPSAHEQRVWLAILNPNSPDTVRALAAVREVTLDGTVTVADVAPPEGRWPVAAVHDGLLFQGDDALEVWDPVSETFVGTLPGPFPVATWQNRIVTCGWACDELHLIDLDADTHRIVGAPEGVAMFDGYGGAFSPDGRYVAVPASETDGAITAETAVCVVVIDLDTAIAEVLPGCRQAEPDYRLPHVAWSSDGEWVFATTGRQLVAHRPGDDATYRVDVDLDGPYLGMAAS